jgi:predicted dehydrogenase
MRVALVGIGGYAQLYARVLLHEADAHQVEFVAAVDPLPDQVPVYPELQLAGVPVYPHLDDFYTQNSADLVIISTPIPFHKPMTLQALEHGDAVLCEKPLAGSWEDGLVMFEAQRKHRLPVAIGYQWSFDPAVQALKADIQAGVFGKPLRLKTLVLWSRRLSYYQRSSWAGRQRMPDGAWVLDSPVNNATAHYLHNMLYVLGKEKETSAWPDRLEAELYRANEIENYDAAAMRIWTDDNVEILFYTAHPVVGDTGPWAVYEFENAAISYRAGEVPSFVAEFKDGTRKDYQGPLTGHMEKLWEVVDALRSGAPPVCGIEAALPHLLCVYGVQQSCAIRSLDEPYRQQTVYEQDRLVWVDGLAEVFQTAFERGQLPHETGLVSWTQPGSVIDLCSERDQIV